jgi:hypothetical protein
MTTMPLSEAAMARIRAGDAALAAGEVTTGAETAALMEEQRARESRAGR